jgi:hypothetical protein
VQHWYKKSKMAKQSGKCGILFSEVLSPSKKNYTELEKVIYDVLMALERFDTISNHIIS